jgi:iron(III) transport system ATP-binding protein
VFPNVTGAPEGALVDIMIRPDDIDFVPDPAGDVVVVGRVFQGAHNLYRLRLPSGGIVHSVQASTTVYPVGTRARVQTTLLHVVSYAAVDGGEAMPWVGRTPAPAR